jgi:hypothetical protein
VINCILQVLCLCSLRILCQAARSASVPSRLVSASSKKKFAARVAPTCMDTKQRPLNKLVHCSHLISVAADVWHSLVVPRRRLCTKTVV